MASLLGSFLKGTSSSQHSRTLLRSSLSERLDAISSVDEAQESKWQQAFAFRTFKEAVVFQLGSIKNPDHHVWEYNPREQPNAADEIRQLLNVAEVEPPSTPPAPATPPRPTLRSLRSPNPNTPPPTPSRRNRSQAEGTSVGTSFVASPQITVHVNQGIFISSDV